MQTELETLREQKKFRSLVESKPQPDGWVLRDGRRMLNLASNHYLGLDSVEMDTSNEELGEHGLGAGASRHVTGHHPLYTRMEEEFAVFKGTESCLLFSCGYMANIGVIPALVGRADYVFSDRLNHASITEGILLSRAHSCRYRHRDIDQLEAQLQKAPAGVKKLIVTDSIFSMDGSMAPLLELVELKDRYGAMLMVDEAHSGGLYSEEGQGLIHALGLSDRVEVQMGTFSKAYGCYGAYVAGDRLLKEYLTNKARSLIYTTALPPVLIAGIHSRWRSVKEQGGRRRDLQQKAARFRQTLQQAGLDTGRSECQIVPLLLGSNERALTVSERLQQEGIAAVAIRPPTVPEGEARIRFSLMATHRDEDLEWALEHIIRIGREES
ncbi:8-amino-7-oxononanoate synthase [Paenibacillus caseinilyticus]|nr:8-amino-7-oxononanoate synthase [Paenibacillus caseinilyticus]MCZ8523065.1 8-amino-7-oxononanoate synthase [Paenibacillus caseinilyticus]